MTKHEDTKTSAAAWAVRAAGAWVLMGALAKLFLGTPKDLPPIVHDLTPFDVDLTFRLVIGVELAIVALAFLRPKLAWPVLVALFVFFDFILVSQLGSDSCGCFGASIKVSPALMLAIDSALLLALLATRPWSRIRRPGLSLPITAVVAAVLFAVPWLVIRDSSAVAPAVAANGAHAPSNGAIAPNEKPKPRWVTLKPDQWVGKSIFDVPELMEWTDADKLPIDGKLVVWRKTCDHCKTHLAKMATDDDGSQQIVLLELRDEEGTSLVDLMPSGPHVTQIQFPEGLQVFLQTPWDIEVKNGVVTAAVHEDS